MYLTKEEENIYNGEHGWANQICMKILVRLGELYNATRLIPIESAHVAGVSYKTLGDAPAEFLRALADAHGKAKIDATLNPQSFDPEYLSKKLSKNLCEKQLEILKHFARMGLTESLTCTPYYLRKPKRNSHLAWAESSAVVYANSVLGAWTNREGGPSALAAAIIGKTPDYGMHKPENRQANILVDVRTRLQNKAEYGALGIHLGKILKDDIPVIQGLNGKSEGKLKQLAAALATTGMTNMFYHNAETKPETEEKIAVENRDLSSTFKSLSTTKKQPDLIFIGCPHCSLDEIKRIANLMNNKSVKANIEFWITTSQHVKEKAGNDSRKIEENGGHVLTNMCTIVSWTEQLGIKTIMTNSAKTAYYAPTLNNAETIFAPLKQCLKTALEG